MKPASRALLPSGTVTFLFTDVEGSTRLIQRLGDGSVEHRVERSFRFGGVIACADGYVELLTLEQRQWEGLV